MSDYNVDTLENKIVVEAQEALKELDKISASVDKTKSSLEKMKDATGLKNVKNDADEAKKKIIELSDITSKFKKVLIGFGGLVYTGKKIANIMTDAAKNSISYIETLNLFEVSMGKTLDQYGNLDKYSSQYYTKALDFQERLNKAFGTNIEETMRYQALYNQMTKSMGISNEASYVISENLTKLGIDLASLFNKEETDTMEALRAGVLAGQTKPLRNYGLDVTQQSLQPLANSLGLDRTVSQLSQAEKMILRYIAVLKQASAAHGDFAKTIESPANQLKIFHQQLAELKTAIGNLFQGLLGQILPYINGAVMALKELIKLLGKVFGFEVTSNNSNLAQTVGVDDLEEGLSAAVGSAKELKAQILGFDNINNITTQTSGGGGVVSSTPNGIDSKLLDALGEYDNLMGDVKMKAEAIKDTILKWLGFTGDVEHDTQRLKEIINKIKTLIETIVITWIGVKAVGAIGTLINALGQKGVLGVTSKIQAGVALIAASWGLAELAAQSYANYLHSGDNKDLMISTAETTVSLLAGAGGGAMIGSTFGPVGTAVGAILGTVGAGAYNIYKTQKTTDDTYVEAISKALSTREDLREVLKNVAKDAQKPDFLGFQMGDYSKEDYDKIIHDWKYKVLDELPMLSSKGQEEVKKLIETYGNLAWAEAYLFDNGGQSIKEYYENYKVLIGEITNSSDKWLNLYDSFKSSNEAIKDASETLDIYISKITNPDYKMTTDDIGKINAVLNQMSDYVKASGDAFVDAAILSTNSLKDEGYISQETADLVVSNAMRKAQAEGDAYEAYKIGIQDLNTQLKNGKITQEQYRIKQQELYNQWQNSVKKVDDLTNSLSNAHSIFSSRIDMGSWNTAAEYVGKFGETFDEAKNKLKDTRDSMISFYEDSIEYAKKELENAREINGEESEQYKEALDRYKGLQEAREQTLNKYDEDLKRVKKSTYENLKQMEQELIDSGYDITEDAAGIYKTIQEQLNKIGTDLDISENLDKEFSDAEKTLNGHKTKVTGSIEAISKIVGGTTLAAIDLGFKLNVDYSGLQSKLKTVRDKIDEMASIPVVGSLLTPFKKNLNTLIDKLGAKGYASGGMPDIGEIFLARESGPELVGSIGRRTAVANNQQIVEAVSRGVYEAVSAAMPKATTVQLDVRADEGIIVKKATEGIRQFVTQTGELPFPLPI